MIYCIDVVIDLRSYVMLFYIIYDNVIGSYMEVFFFFIRVVNFV